LRCMSQRARKLLVSEVIDALPFLNARRDQVVTDYNEKLISFVEAGGENLGPVTLRHSEDGRAQLDLGLILIGNVDTQLLISYADGSLPPNFVSSQYPGA
jgi:hypothetical protein